MNKEEYKKSLHRHYPEEPDNVLELAWHFHGMEKAKKYIKLLETCNHNADLAIKAIRAMYVSCDIDAVKAVSEKFGNYIQSYSITLVKRCKDLLSHIGRIFPYKNVFLSVSLTQQLTNHEL